MWIPVHLILNRTAKDGSQSRKQGESLLLRLMPKHSDPDTVESSKLVLLSYLNVHLSKNFAPFRTILLQLMSTAYAYYHQLVTVQQEGKSFTSAEMENAFALYMKIFEEHMPQEKTWDYLHESKSK
jgi:hypothetical protein